MSETLDHIIRHRIPWQLDKGITECGKEVSAVKDAISWEDFAAKFKREGQQRAAMTTCMTCWGRYETESHLRPGWARSPVDVLSRECQRLENRYGYGTQKTDSPLDKELRAIVALIEAHRDEFDGYLVGLDNTVNLAQRRDRQRPTPVVLFGPKPL